MNYEWRWMKSLWENLGTLHTNYYGAVMPRTRQDSNAEWTFAEWTSLNGPPRTHSANLPIVGRIGKVCRKNRGPRNNRAFSSGLACNLSSPPCSVSGTSWEHSVNYPCSPPSARPHQMPDFYKFLPQLQIHTAYSKQQLLN